MKHVPTSKSPLDRGLSRTIAGLDFGTTFSGFSYASRNDPEHRVYLFYEWPGAQDATSLPYCKTTTSLFYSKDSLGGSWVPRAWGWPAVLESSKRLETFEKRQARSLSLDERKESRVVDTEPSHASISNRKEMNGQSHEATGKLVSLFKLHLATGSVDSDAISLPNGICVDDVIRDYLKEISQFTLRDIKRRFGTHLSMSDIQWALTIPAIWDERAKQRMKRCAEMAGMIEVLPLSARPVNGGSRHPLLLILEPEAASVFCRTLDTWRLSVGDQFVVVDAGGGTVDLVGQEVVIGNATKEVTLSTGGLCGGKFVDEEFFRLAAARIECLKECAASKPASVMAFMRQWQAVKKTFRGLSDSPATFEIPSGLAEEWDAYNEDNNLPAENTDELVLSPADMCKVFDPVISQILALIWSQVRSVPDCKAILLVGGFSASPYLQHRVRSAFLDMSVMIPPNPGAAVCQGATLFALHPNPVTSRKARRTYGISTSRPFLPDDDPSKRYFLDAVFGKERVPLSEDEPPPSGSEVFCDHVFSTYVVQGQEVEVDTCVEEIVNPMYALQKKLSIELLSANGNPRYSTESCVTKEGKFVLHIDDTALGRSRQIKVSMYFGRASVEIRARAMNFGGGDLEKGMVVPVSFIS